MPAASGSRWTSQDPSVDAAPMTEIRTGEREAAGPRDRSGRKNARGGKSGTRSVPATPHDSLFRALVSDPGRAAALIRDHLPKRITGPLSETQCPCRSMAASWTRRCAGASPTCCSRVELASGGPAFVYVLAEHKSHADPGTPLQLAGDMIRYQNVLIAYHIGMFCLSESICDISRLFNWLPGNDSDNVLPRIRPMT